MNDFEVYKKLQQDIEVRRFISSDKPSDEAVLDLFKLQLENTKRVGYWAVCLRKNFKVIGLCKIVPFGSGEFHEIGYSFLPEVWGKGFAKELVVQMVNFCRSSQWFAKLIALTDERNKASIRVLENAGFTFYRKSWDETEKNYVFQFVMDIGLPL